MQHCFMHNEMKALWDEQLLLSGFGKKYRFIHSSKMMDTLPFKLLSSKGIPFTAFIDGGYTPYFRLESLEEGTCFVEMSLLKPVDFKGRIISNENDLYALQKTNARLHVKACTFSAILAEPFELVDRRLPIIASKA